MISSKGVYKTQKKDGTVYYRASITFKNKHISLGSFNAPEQAHAAYMSANAILHDALTLVSDYDTQSSLSYSKWVILHNFRDSNYYFKSPIYLHKRYFTYHLDMDTLLYFDVDDLFYYSSHPIHRRGGYYFVNDYGMQLNILSRYKIRNHSIEGIDYRFIDGNQLNFRYDNIEVLNPYHGVELETKKNRTIFKARIHINGNTIIGRYSEIHMAAIAYNKAVDYVKEQGISQKNYVKNYLEDIPKERYLELYDRIRLSEALLRLAKTP